MTPFKVIFADGIHDGVKASVGILLHNLEEVDIDSQFMAGELDFRFLAEVDAVELKPGGVSDGSRLCLPSSQLESWSEQFGLKHRQERALLFNIVNWNPFLQLR